MSSPRPRHSWSPSSLGCALVLALSLSAVRAAAAPAGGTTAPAAGSPDSKKTTTKKAPEATARETTLKGEMTCAKCGLHETSACQGVLRVKDASGKETKYYMKPNAVAEKEHEKVCGGSAAATVTGTVAVEGGKKTVTASSIKYE